MHEDTSRETRLLAWFATGFVLVLAIKIYLAAVLDLYSDEVFYWWASTRLSLAYSDLPFMTALLAGLGSGFEPATALQVRSLFLLLGSGLPLLVYWVALPIYGRTMALQSAILTLCLPLGGFMGLLAVPDVPLVCFGLLAIGSFERAIRSNAWRWWLATGLWVALGLCTHYRFLLYPLAALLFLGFHSPAQNQWRNRRFWSAVALASLGLIPILWFNLSNQLSSASFYLLERHPWEFQASGLLHLFKQAALVTPPLYLVFLLTLWHLVKQSQENVTSAALLLSFALTNLSVYLLLAPWTDANSTSIHWPLSGYFPLLVAVPDSLLSIYRKLDATRGDASARKIIASVPLIGFAGTLVAFIGVGSQAFQEPLQRLIGTGVLSNKMAGWREFALHTEQVLDRHFQSPNPLVLSDNYYTAAQVEFAGLSSETLTLDQDKAVRDGRITQLQLWNKTHSGIGLYEGQPALYISEDSTLEIDDETALMSRLCESSGSLEFLESLRLFNGDKAFSYYAIAELTNPDDEKVERASPCPYPTHAWIDAPRAGELLTGQATVAGWAYNEDIGVERVELLIDGSVVAQADYGENREDVVRVRGIQNDPNAPNLGFSIALDTRVLENGRYELAIAVNNLAGRKTVYGKRTVRIEN